MAKPVTLYWNRCKGDVWGELATVNLDDRHFDNLSGVYLIWHGGAKPGTVCVGQGPIRERLKERRFDPALAAFREETLYVSWAKVETVLRLGVERFLLETLRPKVPSAAASSPTIEVNLPGRGEAGAPDVGVPPPDQIWQDMAAQGAAPASLKVRDVTNVETPKAAAAAAAPAAAPAPKVKRISRLQQEFNEFTAKSSQETKGGLFGGGGKPKPDEEGRVVAVVQMIMKEASVMRASDVHLEPLETRLRVRFRVDGILEEVLSVPNSHNLRVVSHIRVMCCLDPEKGVGTGHPEDGRMAVTVEGLEADLRLSTFPTPHGDKAVLRILPRSSKVPALEELGLQHKTQEVVRHLIGRPQGMIIVTGPTGSGKSTTLYTMLQTLNDPARNIVTLEDPIEKKIPGINQGMLQPKAGFTFSEGLRAILRQDPNIIMVGEIRDTITAEIAMSASLTGHLVFTTLHTNSALGAVTRLLDMGLEPFLISAALTAVFAQRLARKVCQGCKEPYKLSAEELAEAADLARRGGVKLPPGFETSLVRGRGCTACRDTGFQGRLLLTELIVTTPALRQLILKKGSLDELRATAIAEGMETMLMDGLKKAAAGLTSFSEIVRCVDIAD